MKSRSSDILSLIDRIQSSETLPPVLKAQLLERVDSLDPDSLRVIAELMQQADSSGHDFGVVALQMRRVLERIDRLAGERVQLAAEEILAEFEMQLQQVEE